MEISSTSRALHLQRHVGCRRINFSHVSSSHRNPNRSETFTNRKIEEEGYDLLSTLKKHNKLFEKEDQASNKRQKRTMEHDSPTTKVCSVFRSETSRNSFKSRTTTLVDPKVTTSSTLPRIRIHPKTKTNPIDKEIGSHGCSLKDLIAKAKNKGKEKRQTDGRREYIARKRLEARLAVSRIVPTVAAEDHLEYHIELEKLGCTFIHDQVICLTKFSLRIGSCDESNSSFLGKTEFAESTNRGKRS